jgi:hypothetical protein
MPRAGEMSLAMISALQERSVWLGVTGSKNQRYQQITAASDDHRSRVILRLTEHTGHRDARCVLTPI